MSKLREIEARTRYHVSGWKLHALHLLWCFFPLFATQALAQDAVDGRYFGMHIHNAASGTRWPDVPVGSWRLWDASVNWPDLQPAADRWDFTRLDLYVGMAGVVKTELLLPLGLSPAWASSRPREQLSYGPGNVAEPRSIDDWNRYVATVARRYKGKIAAYEIWNEPNAHGFFSGDIDTMVKLTCSAYKIIKQVDPQALVVSPAATYQAQGVAWLDRFISHGGKGCFDVVGFHFYTLAHEPPEAMLPLVEQVRSVLAAHGLSSLEIWNTEAGWIIKNAHRPVRVPWRTLNDEAAAYVGRALILGWTSGLRRFYWYAWDDGNYGLMETEDGSLKKAAIAYRNTVRWILGAQSLACATQDAHLMVCKMEKDGEKAWMIWSLEGERSFNIPNDWNVSSQEMLVGNSAALKPGDALIVGQMPMLLQGAAQHSNYGNK
jgi:hypothetical protein